MERRTVLQLISAGVLSQGFDPLRAFMACQAVHPPLSVEPYKLRFFSAAENKLLDSVMELIIPADSHSPGAHAAKVSEFTDWMVSTSEEPVQREWRKGVKLLQEEVLHSSPAAALAKAARNEAHPSTDLERFFIQLKSMTVDGYYTTEIGIHKDLQYVGNAYNPDYKGCTHPEHQTSKP
jgi:hypothetical protein